MATRATEAYWAGFVAWCLDATDRPARRHTESVARIRALSLEVGEGLVALRHGGRASEVRARLDQLTWQLELAARRRALGRDVLDRCVEAVRCLDGLLPSVRPRVQTDLRCDP